MAGARSLPTIFQTIFQSDTTALNAVVEDECKVVTLPDGSVVQATPDLCAQKSMQKYQQATSGWTDKAGQVVQAIAGFIPVIGTASSVALKAANYLQTSGQNNLIAINPKPGLVAGGGTKMGFFDDILGGVQSATQGIFSSNSGFDWTGLLNTGVALTNQALAPRSTSMAAPASMAPAMSAAGAVARTGAVVARGFFNRFPNLATAIQTLRNGGMNVTRAKLYGVMKRFGPEFLVTGGLLTAAAVNELAVAGPGYRRMNPANVRALRRSVRRIESFHRLCKTTDRLRGPKRKAHK